MNLYQRLGFLVLGSRLRRISDSFLSEITRAYQNEGIEFDASWFPVFYLLAENNSLSIKELSEQTEVSHPAASQFITGLKNKGLVTTATCADDGRKQLVTFTAKGRELLTRVQPVWDAILLSMNEVMNNEPEVKKLLQAITALETAFQETNLAERIDKHLVNSLNFPIMNSPFNYGTDHLTVGICLELAAGKRKGIINAEAQERINASQKAVREIVHKQVPVYGINTGFGPLCDTHISEDDTALLQSNILKSHSVGVGKPIPKEISKLMLITKVQALAQGYSGVRMEILERIIWHIDNDVISVVPEKGSVGASGDLAPLSHLFLPLIGLGEVWVGDGKQPAAAILKQHGIEPIALGPKEGLALINGTQFILAFAVKAIERLSKALDIADLAGAMSLEGLMGSSKPFDPRLHQLRPYKGNIHVANNLFTLLDDSEIRNSHVDCDRVQDPYSLRCMPQVHGASRNTWLHLKELTEIELNSVTDNPIIFNADDTISGGNFHGQPLAMALDYATVAAAELGNIADRRCYLMSEGRYGLPKLLVPNAGLNSGLMIPQYTTAALVTENKTFCFPASADSVPTSLGQEDHVSMGSISSRKLHMVLDNLEYIQAIELLYASQALDFRRPLKSTPVIEACHKLIREHVPFIDHDRVFADDINNIYGLLTSGTFLNNARETSIKNQLNLFNNDDFGIY